MSLIQIDPIGWIPDSVKQQITDGIVTSVADQAKKILGDEMSQALKRLRSDAAFQDAVDRGLKEATARFVREYTVEDKDLVAAIARDPDFWKAKSVRQALLEIIKHPGVYLADDRMTLARSFTDVLRQRVNRERVDRAVTFYLRCVAESLWHLEPLRPVYELQMQRLSVERASEMVQELRWMRADVQQAMVALIQAIGGQQRLLVAPGGQALSEPKKVYHNLPQPDYGVFIGREKELAQVHRILRPYPHSQHALVTVDGIGGIGKSALALEVAHRYLRDYDRLPPEERFEAIIWASAKSSVLTTDGIAPRQQITRTLDDIYTTIAVTLEREDITRARSEEQDELVTKALTQQRTLLIMDNLETVDDERVNAFLRELPAPTKSIVTTRHRIDVAYPARLTGMPKEDGLALIAQECAKKNVTLTDGEAEKLYDRIGGVPLAIVWSVAQMGYGYDVETILRRLGQPSEDISRFCFEGTIERVRDTDAHRLLMSLSLFATDASREALGYVAGLGKDVLSRNDGLATLEKLSLVNRHGGRFSLLPLTRAYLNAEMEQDKDLNNQLRERWLSCLKEISNIREHGFYWQWGKERFLKEGENILQAINWVNDQGRESDTVSLTPAVCWYLEREGRWIEAINTAERGLKLAERISAQDSALMLRIFLAWVYNQEGRSGRARRLLESNLVVCEQLGNRKAQSTSIAYLARLACDAGEYDQAASLYENAMQMARELKDVDLIACIEHELGKMASVQERWEGAESHFMKVRQWFEAKRDEDADLGDRYLYNSTYSRLGAIFYQYGEYGRAKHWIQKGIDFFSGRGNKTHFVRAKMWLALVEEILGNLTTACQHTREALEWAERLNLNWAKEELDQLMERVCMTGVDTDQKSV